MAQLTADVHAHNSRATHPHILPLPLWVFALRCLQALLSLVTLALSAVPLTYFPGFGGYGLNIFTSLLTWIFLLYAALTAWRFPAAYNKWAHLALEIALVVFWLCTFATLASHAAFFAVYYNHGYREDPETEAAIACTQAAAALTAFTWVSFIATLVHTCKLPPNTPRSPNPEKIEE